MTQPSTEDLDRLLAAPIHPGYPRDGTVREYLAELLERLWVEADGFNSKRPLGDSDWRWHVHEAAAHEALVDATMTLHGQLHINTIEADRIIVAAIRHMCGVTP